MSASHADVDCQPFFADTKPFFCWHKTSFLPAQNPFSAGTKPLFCQHKNPFLPAQNPFLLAQKHFSADTTHSMHLLAKYMRCTRQTPGLYHCECISYCKMALNALAIMGAYACMSCHANHKLLECIALGGIALRDMKSQYITLQYMPLEQLENLSLYTIFLIYCNCMIDSRPGQCCKQTTSSTCFIGFTSAG